MARADNEADLQVNIDVKSKKAQAGFDQAAKKVSGFGSKVKSISTGILGASAIQDTASAIWDFGKKAVSAYGKSQQSAVMYSDAMKRIPGASDKATAALLDQASALASITTFGKGTVKQGQAVLASFGLTAAQIKELTPLMLDYATKTGQDVPASAKQLGRALMGQGRALKNIGIDFKDTGSLQGNFNQLTKDLTGTVGGLAEQMGTTSAGQMEIMKNQLKALTVAFGKFLYPMVKKVIEILIELVQWLQKNSEWLIPLVSVITAAAGAFLAMASAVKVATAAVKLLKAAAALSKANPWMIIITGAVALGVALYELYNHWTWFHDAVDAVWQALQKGWDAVVKAFKVAAGWIVDAVKWIWERFGSYFKMIYDIVAKYIGMITLPFRIAFDLIKAIVSGDFDKVLAIFKGIPGRVGSALGGLFNAVTAPFKKALDWVLNLIPGFWTWAQRVPGYIASALSSLWSIITSPFQRAYDTVRGIISGMVNWVTGQFDRIKGIAQGALNFVKGIYNGFARTWNAIQVTVPGIDKGPIHIGGFTIGLPDLPILAKGAYADRGTLAMFGEAGPEWVLPERRLAHLLTTAYGAGAGVSQHQGKQEVKFIVNVPPTANPVETGRAVANALRAYVRAGGQLPGRAA